MLRFVIDTGVAMLAVFGFCCALRMLLDLLFSSDRIAVAVEVLEKRDAEMLDLLLREAQSASVGRGRARLIVLLSSALMDGTVGTGDVLDEDYAALIDGFGAECYLIEPE